MRCPAAFVVLLVLGVASFSGCRRAAPPVSAAAARAGQAFAGTIAETMNAGGYTYVRLQAAGKEDVWIAAPEFKGAIGDRLSVALEMPMTNFESKTLDRTFPLVYFVSQVSSDGQTVGVAHGAGAAPRIDMMTSRTPSATPALAEPMAPPEGGLSIADVWARRKELSGHEVLVRGRVVKANNQILGTNWIHLQDGSGYEAERTHDLTITTDAVVQVGDVITVKGLLATGKDIGGGYAYDAIIENARLVK